MIERPKRSFAKTISWRVIATLTTMTIVYFLTGEIALSFAAGGIDVSVKIILYFLHERAWNRVTWGRGT